MFSITQEYLNGLFPADKTDDFFEALFGDTEEGAYDIVLVLDKQNADVIELRYELHGRVGKCLACNLTTGLPNVFQRHPIIAASNTAETIAKDAGWDSCEHSIGRTQQVDDKLHFIPFTISKK